MTIIRLVILSFWAAVLVGCATQHSPLHGSDGAFIFVTNNEDAILDVAYDAMAAGEPGLTVTAVSGPVRGFTMRKQWALDYWTSTLLVHAAKGVTATGEELSGYYPEVTGEGSLVIRGPNMDKRIYEAVLRGFERIGPRRSVIQLDKGTYVGEVSVQPEYAKPQSKQTPIGRSAEDRLLELDSLLKKGLITPDEYEKARKVILQDL